MSGLILCVDMAQYSAIVNPVMNLPLMNTSRGNILIYHSVMVELAEMLTSEIDFGNCCFAKNGSDLTTWSIRVAREFSRNHIS